MMQVRRARAHERGQGLVEFAVVFPLVVFFLFGVFEVGLGLNRQATLQHAVREGARQGALVDDYDQGNPPGTAAADRTTSQSRGLLKALGDDITVEYKPITDEGCAVDVTGTYEYRPAMLGSILSFLGVSTFPDHIEMKVTGSARMERTLHDGC